MRPNFKLFTQKSHFGFEVKMMPKENIQQFRSVGAWNVSFCAQVACKSWPDKGPSNGAVIQGPRSKFSSGGAKEECVKENFGEGVGGGILVDFYSISLK